MIMGATTSRSASSEDISVFQVMMEGNDSIVGILTSPCGDGRVAKEDWTSTHIAASLR